MCVCVCVCVRRGSCLAKVAGARLSPLMETARTATSFHRHTLTFRLAAAPAIFVHENRPMDSSRRNGNRFVTSASFGKAGLAAKWNSIDRLGLQSTLSLSLSLSLSISLCVRTCSFGIEDTETAMIFVVPPAGSRVGLVFRE